MLMYTFVGTGGINREGKYENFCLDSCGGYKMFENTFNGNPELVVDGDAKFILLKTTSSR